MFLFCWVTNQDTFLLVCVFGLFFGVVVVGVWFQNLDKCIIYIPLPSFSFFFFPKKGSLLLNLFLLKGQYLVLNSVEAVCPLLKDGPKNGDI